MKMKTYKVTSFNWYCRAIKYKQDPVTTVQLAGQLKLDSSSYPYLKNSLQAISSKPVVLGGENTSHALYENSGFSIKVRAENLRGGNKTSGLMLDTELVSNTSFKKNKNLTNRLFQRSNFVQGYNCPNRPYEHRDVNGLYKLANVIGIPYPYKPLKMSSLLIKHPATNYNIRYINP